MDQEQDQSWFVENQQFGCGTIAGWKAWHYSRKIQFIGENLVL